MSGAVSIEAVSFDDERVQALVEVVQQEYVRRYGSPDETPIDVAMFEPPEGQFFVAVRDGEPIAMGGWRFRPDVDALGARSVAEVKRMFVLPGARRTGLARLVLRTLEHSARKAGHDVLVLETGERQPEAIELYESAGYVQVVPFGHYKDSPIVRCYGRRLSDVERS